MIELYLVLFAILGFIVMIFSARFIYVILREFHPTYAEIRTILEQANIYQDGVLTEDQFNFLSHLSSQPILAQTPWIIVGGMLVLFFIVLYVLCSSANINLFKKIVGGVVLFYVLFCGQAYLNHKNEPKLHRVVDFFYSEDLYLKAIKKDKDNQELKDVSERLKNNISHQDMQRFFEDQKI